MRRSFALAVAVTLGVMAGAGFSQSLPEVWPPRPGPLLAGPGRVLDVETISGKRIGEQFVYSANFLCGPDVAVTASEAPEPVITGFPLGPVTAINIHNPNATSVTLSLKASEAKPVGQERGKISAVRSETLAPDEALEANCETIRTLLEPRPGNTEKLSGFVVAAAAQELDVVAVYSMRGRSWGARPLPPVVIQPEPTPSPQPGGQD